MHVNNGGLDCDSNAVGSAIGPAIGSAIGSTAALDLLGAETDPLKNLEEGETALCLNT